MSSPPTTVAPSVASLAGGSLRLRFQRAGAWLIVGLALADFLRWRAVGAKWIGFGGMTPMAPATEWQFVVLGVALGLHLFFPEKPAARRLAVALSSLAALAALHVLFCHLQGRAPQWESRLGFGRMAVTGYTVGYISSQSALLSLFSNFALLALASPLAGRTAWRDAGIFAALAVELFALVTVVSYAAGNPPVSNDGWLKVAPLVMFEFTLFNLVLLVGGRATNRLRHWFFGTDPAAPDFAPVSREERLVFGLLAGAGLMALAASLVYLRLETKHYQDRTIAELETISRLKADQIEEWRRERFGDARTLMRSPLLAETVQALPDESSADSRRAALADWLRVFVREYGYARLVVLNRAMEPLLAEPGPADLGADGLREHLRALRPDSGPTELPPYLDGAGVLHWDLLVPLRSSQPGALAGAILLQTNLSSSILRALQSWQAEYQTGQSMLWYRNGDRLISLGGYRPIPGTLPEELRPLGMIRSLSDPAQSQSMLVRLARGELGMGEGLDHRGIMIVGFGRPIADSSWLLSSRVDSSEVYAPLRRTAVGVAGLVAGLFGATGLATSWLWRRRQGELLHDRLTAELEQKRLAARLGAVMLLAKDIILLLDDKLLVVDANQQAVETYGWSRAELLQKTIHEIRSPDSPTRIEDIAPSFSGGKIFESLHRRRDGTTFPVESSVRSVEFEGEQRLLVIARDITDRKRAEAALRASEERYRLIADNTSDLIWLYDQAADRFTYASPASASLLGYRPEEIVGRKLLDFMTPASEERARRGLEQALADAAETRAPVHLAVELEQRRKDGSLVPTEVVTSVLSDATGRVTHILGVTRDITERRQAREAQEAQANLERERQVSEMKSQFVSVASHEFRTPLAAAVGSLELLERHAAKLTEAKRGELLGRVRTSLGRLTAIMNDVLQLSRADSGRVKVKWMNVDLGRFAQDVVNEVADGDRQQHAFSFEQSGGAGPVPADTNLLHHILSNLVGNAARYSPPGTRVSVQLALEAEAYTLTVTDEGIGIPAAERERIFEPFVRGSNVGQIGGTGLGLNIVKRYTELMGGRIEVMPTDRGAAFRVRVPFPNPAPTS